MALAELQRQVVQLRADIHTQQIETRAALNDALTLARTRRIQTERARRVAARQAAEQRRQAVRQLHDDIRVKLEVDMEMLHAGAHTLRAERAEHRANALKLRNSRVLVPLTGQPIRLESDTMPLDGLHTNAVIIAQTVPPLDAPQLVEPDGTFDSDSQKNQTRRKTAKSAPNGVDLPDTILRVEV